MLGPQRPIEFAEYLGSADAAITAARGTAVYNNTRAKSRSHPGNRKVSTYGVNHHGASLLRHGVAHGRNLFRYARRARWRFTWCSGASPLRPLPCIAAAERGPLSCPAREQPLGMFPQALHRANAPTSTRTTLTPRPETSSSRPPCSLSGPFLGRAWLRPLDATPRPRSC